MPASAYQIEHTRRYCIRLLERKVFSQLVFLDKAQRDIVYDSYVQNINVMVAYVVENQLDFEKYFQDIKTILLNSKNVRERTR